MNKNDRATAADIARLAGVSPAAVSNWQRRHPDFPPAATENGRRTFSVSEVTAWLDDREIVVNDRETHESRASSRSSRSSDGPPDPTAAEKHAVKNLKGAFEFLQGSDSQRVALIILEALYVRFYQPARWGVIRRSAIDSADWGTALEHDLSPDGPGHFLPLADLRAAQALGRAMETIDGIDPDISGNGVQLARRIGEHIVAQLVISCGRSINVTPESLVKLVMSMTRPTHADRIHDPFCNLGELLVGAKIYARAGRGDPDTASPHLSGQTPNAFALALARARLRLHAVPAEQLWIGWALLNPPDQQEFDLVVTNPPFNMTDWAHQEQLDNTDWRFGSPPTKNANFAWLQHVVMRLSAGGRAAVLMPNNATSSANNREHVIRSALVSSGALDAIVALPSNLFESTTIPVTLWILRRPGESSESDVLFIDARHLGSMSDRTHKILGDDDIAAIARIYHGRSTLEGNHVNARLVPTSEIRESSYILTPARYVAAAQPPTDIDRSMLRIGDLHQRLLARRSASTIVYEKTERRLAEIESLIRELKNSSQQVRLGEVCEVLAGTSGSTLRPADADDGVPVVKPKNIGEYRLVLESLDYVQPPTDYLRRYQLRAGDIVCTRTGDLGRQALVTNDQNGWLFSASCARLRPDETLSARFLLYHLRHPATRAWIRGNAGGTAIPVLTSPTLRDLPLSLPPTGMQDAVASILEALDDEISVHLRAGRTVASLRDSVLPLLVPSSSDRSFQNPAKKPETEALLTSGPADDE
jgi:type I restriction enzyme M protein